MDPKQISVVGGGIVGLAAAYRLGQKFPDAEVTVFEKEPRVGMHQSGHNSGVLHAGLYYKPGSAKARLAVRGIRQMIEFCRENAIPHEICGKLVVATAEEELPRLRELFDRGQKNGLQGLQMLGPEQIREIEPHAAGIAAIRVPEEGIADYPAVCDSLAGKIRGRVLTGSEVRELEATATGSGGENPRRRVHIRPADQLRRLAMRPGEPDWPACAPICALFPSGANITRSGPDVRTWSAI